MASDGMNGGVMGDKTTLAQLLLPGAAAEKGDQKPSEQIALYKGSHGGSLTRNKLFSLAVEFANVLRGSGIKPGDTVTLVDSNTIEFVVAFLGVTFSRAVVAPLNQNYTSDEFKFYMEDAESKLLVVGSSGNAAAEGPGIVPCIRVSIEINNSESDAKQNATLCVESKGDLVIPEPQSVAKTLEDEPQPGDVALFLHTSGTTSRPKGVPLTHGNLMASLYNIKATYEFNDKDVSLLVMPLFHVHGLMAGLFSPLLAEAAVVLPAAGKFSAGTFWKDAVDYGVTYYTAVPTMHQILVSRAQEDYPKDNPPPIRIIRSCSSSLAPATLHQVEALFGAPVLEAYAMTEASHQMTSNPLPQHGERKPGTVGIPQGTVKVAILDDKCNILPPGEQGEVCIQGPNVTKGYKNNDKANAEAFAGGWFHTGDQGYLSEDGYLTLTGRIKELINRGGEKISPLEVDATLLAHPLIGEAVSFAAPDEKYGEDVAAAVVLNGDGQKALEDQDKDKIILSIKDFCKEKLAAFKVPKQIFVTDNLPKNATGKIQRRFMVDAFITNKKSEIVDGYDLVAATLSKLGIKYMFGVIGIPVTRMASAAQAAGIRFISFRNEQAAGYAAAASGFLSGKPGVLLTVSGPGMIHGLSGLCHAKENNWPLLMISGSCETDEIGKGAFQELDQCIAATPYVKLSSRAKMMSEIPRAIQSAFQTCLSGDLGPSYVDIPSNIFMQNVSPMDKVDDLLQIINVNINEGRTITRKVVESLFTHLKSSKRPLLVVGVGCAARRLEAELRELVDAWNIPFITASMARGVVQDSSNLCVNAARSLALSKSDLVVVIGASLNWQLHFAEPPKWSADTKFILLDASISSRDKKVACLWDECNLKESIDLLSKEKLVCPATWLEELSKKVSLAKDKLAAKLRNDVFPLNFGTTLRVIRDEILKMDPAPVVVSEGANTMDQARILLEPVDHPRRRIDAGAWGTMGIGPGSAIAAAVTEQVPVIAVEGDSAFGFSGMEIETACRYKLPITFIIFNNGGIYGGDRRSCESIAAATQGLKDAGYPEDPSPTSFVPNAQYDLLATAFGGKGVSVRTAEELKTALRASIDSGRTTLINVSIDPQAGVESGAVHAFNAPKKE